MINAQRRIYCICSSPSPSTLNAQCSSYCCSCCILFIFYFVFCLFSICILNSLLNVVCFVLFCIPSMWFFVFVNYSQWYVLSPTVACLLQIASSSPVACTVITKAVIGLSLGFLVGWLLGWLVGWLLGWLWLVGWLTRLVGRLTGRLAGGLAGRLDFGRTNLGSLLGAFLASKGCGR